MPQISANIERAETFFRRRKQAPACETARSARIRTEQRPPVRDGGLLGQGIDRETLEGRDRGSKGQLECHPALTAGSPGAGRELFPAPIVQGQMLIEKGFQACRYQASGGVIITSPCRSPALCRRLRTAFQGLTVESHKAGLTHDLLEPRSEIERIGAYERVCYYYPHWADDKIVQALSTPTYSGASVRGFVWNVMSKDIEPLYLQARLSEFTSQHGAVSREGVHLELQEYLEVMPPTPALADLLQRGFLAKGRAVSKEKGSRSDAPINVWRDDVRARFIGSLVCDDSEKVDKAIYKIFVANRDDDFLALCCVGRRAAGPRRLLVTRPRFQFYASRCHTRDRLACLTAQIACRTLLHPSLSLLALNSLLSLLPASHFRGGGL
jgi:hypothetical protein